MRPRIGVLALQGDVAEHEAALRRAGAAPVRVRDTAALETLDGLVIPGGESTTIGALAEEAGLTVAIRQFVESGRPVWGTCAGLILLARDVGAAQPLAGGLDVAVNRNAFGRQVNSFETDLRIPLIGERPFRGIFIRAPSVSATGPGVEVIASLEDGTVVAVRQGRVLGTAFHPELSGDDRIHEMFVEWVGERRETAAAT